MLVLAPSAYAAQCKTFTCKSFEAGVDDTCVFVNTTDSSEQLVRKCDGDKGCSALGWSSITQASENATCADPSDPEKNVTLPGDQCTANDECLAPLMSGEYENVTVTCTSGACKTTNAIGDFCDNSIDGDVTTVGSNFCPQGSYCDLDNKNCTAVKGDGEVCSALEQCPTGWGCYKKIEDGVEDFTCQKYWTVEDGTKVDKTYLRGGALLAVADVCKSHHYIDVDGQATQIECRKAPVSVNVTSEADLKKPDGPTENDCSYTNYDKADNATEPQDATDTSLCGFNKDGASYCNKRKGDSWFQDVLKKVQGKDLSSVSCHANSPLTTCVDAGAKIGTSDYKAWVREILSISTYANYADNDNCVASSVTAEFWQGDSPDFAFNSLTMSSMAMIVLSISAMLFMF